MGICANVLFEVSGLWRGWTSDSLDEALAGVKSRLGLKQDPRFDVVIRRRLEEELVYREGKYVWPQSVRSALVYWDMQ